MAPKVHGFTRRDVRIAQMVAEGLTDPEIAEKLKCRRETIWRRRSQPAVKQLIADTASTYAQRIGAELAHRVAAKAPYTWQFLEDVMLGKYDHMDPEIVRVRVAAATKLLDRQVPKQLKKTEDKTVRFLFQREEQTLIDQTLRAAGFKPPVLIDVTPDVEPSHSRSSATGTDS